MTRIGTYCLKARKQRDEDPLGREFQPLTVYLNPTSHHLTDCLVTHGPSPYGPRAQSLLGASVPDSCLHSPPRP